jgi:Las17-binding protein actin regulator
MGIGRSNGVAVGAELVNLLAATDDESCRNRPSCANHRYVRYAHSCVPRGLAPGSDGPRWPQDRSVLVKSALQTRASARRSCTYTRSSGLFAGAVVSGAVVTQDNDATLALYGKHLDSRQIGRGGQNPATGQRLRRSHRVGGRCRLRPLTC